ncbi:MAG: metallophosphoesterase [Crocinitomicaceae bacterium]|nr:metallophosphoesterase [Crocinitomicaceae bacterium]
MKLLLFISILALTSCAKDKVPEDIIKDYIHISHTRMNNNSDINSISKNINYLNYDLTLLGGDLAFETSADNTIMELIESTFRISSPKTLWSLGNHDYTDTSLIKDYTNRKPFYSFFHNDITFLVLDTQQDNCSIIDEQLELFNNVVDTISNSSHLILLTHKLLWMVDHPILHDQIPHVSNGHLEPYSHSLFPNNFYTTIYPRLKELRSRNIEVLCLAGDLGLFTNKFEYKTADGIIYLASGLESGTINEKYLILHHNISQRELSWEYK